MMASVDFVIFGASRSSKRTSPGPYRTAPRIVVSEVPGKDARRSSEALDELTLTP